MTFTRILVVTIQFCIQASSHDNEFHHNLNPDDLKHYFGTPSIDEVPEYEFIPLHAFSTDEKPTEYQRIRFEAFNQEYNIHLHRNRHLVSPGCIISYLDENKPTQVMPCSLESSHCHYLGSLHENNQSSVAISTCNGVLGVVSVENHDLFIQPVSKPHRKFLNPEHSHIVFKRSTADVKSYSFENESIAESRRYMEVKVVVAHDSYRFHGIDTERFTLTVMNMAAKIFLDWSLGDSKVYLTLIEMVILEKELPNLPILSDAGNMLKVFCSWQKRHERHKIADGTILMTKTNLIQDGDWTNVGLAKINGACDPNNKCTVSEDTGLDTASTIAHELGHSLGMRHDNDENNCSDFKYIMASSAGASKSSLHWSTCSAKYLQRFLTTSQANCLLDKPKNEITPRNGDIKPGEVYTADDQCSMIFNTKSTRCPRDEYQYGLCVMGCMNPNTDECIIYPSPFADGTECGYRQWCIDGVCVQMGADAPKPINGGWSAYDEKWTSCSRSCGGGVSLKRRYCINPRPQYGGSDCSGKKYIAKLCNIQPCSKTQLKFREEQCTSTNGIPVNNTYMTFVPFTSLQGDASCSLYCSAIQNGKYYKRAENVKDGTTCVSSSKTALLSRCVSGKCEIFGCDGYSWPLTSFDTCGVCNGDGSSCSGHTGLYHKNYEPKVFTDVIRIPKGSTGITIFNKNQFSYMSIVVGRKRLLGGKKTQASNGTYTSSGVRVEYRKSEWIESIKVLGTLHRVIKVQVIQLYDASIYEGVTPNISFTYYTSKRPHQRQLYKWITPRGRCNQTCGTGYIQRTAKCIRIRNGAQVSDSHCGIFSKPQETPLRCNRKRCPPRWDVSPFGHCSMTCGGGVKRRAVTCMTTENGTFVMLNSTYCDETIKPHSEEECATNPCEVKCKSDSCKNGGVCNVDNNEIVCKCNKDWEGKKCDEPVSDTCKDQVDCEDYEEDICTNFTSWSRINCPRFCNMCVSSSETCFDREICTQYGDDVCTKFKEWSEKNCRKHCKFCEPCTDARTDCVEYSKDACLPQYSTWALRNCRRFCNLCDIRVKRSVEGNTMVIPRKLKTKNIHLDFHENRKDKNGNTQFHDLHEHQPHAKVPSLKNSLQKMHFNRLIYPRHN